jgi:hypothetical protein
MVSTYSVLAEKARVNEAHGEYTSRLRNSNMLIQSELRNSYEQQIRAKQLEKQLTK